MKELIIELMKTITKPIYTIKVINYGAITHIDEWVIDIGIFVNGYHYFKIKKSCSPKVIFVFENYICETDNYESLKFNNLSDLVDFVNNKKYNR